MPFKFVDALHWRLKLKVVVTSPRYKQKRGGDGDVGDAEMSNWSTERILRALATLDETALPDDFLEVRTAEYRLLCYPVRLISPTLPPAQVVWSQTSRPLDIVFEEIASEIRGWGLDVVHWWVTSTTRPPRHRAVSRKSWRRCERLVSGLSP